MFAGLPGTGIGGVFYLLLTLWMPVHEMYLTWHGRSSLERWKFIAGRWAIFGAVIGVIWLQVVLIKGIFPQGAPAASARLVETIGGKGASASSSGVLLGSTLFAGIVLVAVVGSVHLLRIGFWYRAYLRDLAHEMDLAADYQRIRNSAARRIDTAVDFSREFTRDARIWFAWNVRRRFAAVGR